MILIDKVQMTTEDVAEMFNVPLTKLTKRPEFDLNESRKNTKKIGQSKEISSPAGTRVPAYFMGKWKGKVIEIRYAEAINQVYKGEKLVDEYHPLKVMFSGEAMLVESTDPDLAVYFYLHPLQETSPFRDQIKERWHWSFKDLVARSTKELEKFNTLREALNEIEDLDGEKLKVVAKGMGISGVDSMEEVTIKAELSKKAAENPETFMANLTKKEIMFRGLILNGIDRSLFKIKDNFGNKSWVWGAGKFTGSPVVDIVSDTIPHTEVLVNHILSNINYYYAEIMNVTSSLNAKEVATDYLNNSDFDLDSVLGGNKRVIKPEYNALHDSEFKEKLPERIKEAEIGGGTDEISSHNIREELLTDDFSHSIDTGNDKSQPATQPEVAEVNAEKAIENDLPDFMKPKPEQQKTTGRGRGGNQ